MAKVKQKQSNNIENLVNIIKKNQGHESARVLGEANDPPYYLSTGDDVLDILISNKKHAGIPAGRISEIAGLQGAGKSLLCAHLIKSCQEKNGIPILIDTEASASWQFMKAINVDINKVIYYDTLRTVEQIHKATEELMYTIRLHEPDAPILIIVDSLTAATTEMQISNKDYENKGYIAALKAKMNSQALRKLLSMASMRKVALVYTSQLRYKLDNINPYMDPYRSSSGGSALQFYASVRIRLEKKSKLKEKIHGVDTVVGVRTKARIDKSKLGATYRTCQFDVYFDSGIANYTNWLQTLKKYKVIEGKGTKNIPYVIKYNEQEIVLPSGHFEQVIKNNKQIKQQVYDILYDLLALKYRSIDDLPNRQIIVEDEEYDNEDT